MPDNNEPTFSIIPLAETALTIPAAAAPPPVSSVVDAEWVRRFPARRLESWLRWPALMLKLAAAGAAAWLFLMLPAGDLPSPLQTWKNPVIILLLVCFIG